MTLVDTIMNFFHSSGGISFLQIASTILYISVSDVCPPFCINSAILPYSCYVAAPVIPYKAISKLYMCKISSLETRRTLNFGVL